MLRVTAADAVSLEKAAAADKGETRIWIDRLDAVEAIRVALSKEKGGRGRVVMLPCLHETQDVEIGLPEPYMVTPRLVEQLRQLTGVLRVEER
jgi:DNA polymerase III subunit alpha